MSKPSKIPLRTQIPLRDTLGRMRIAPGHCLDHVERLLDLRHKDPTCPYVVCMGYRFGAWHHCWLEAKEIVVDLTLPVRSRFFRRRDYYLRFEIQSARVLRYTGEQCASLLSRDDELRFCGLDETGRYEEGV
jgi:hypothetical protein